MPVATSSPVKRAAGEGEEKGEGPTKGKQVRLQRDKSLTGVALHLVPNSPTSRRAQRPKPVLVSRSLMWQPLLLMLLKLQLGKVVKELRCLTHQPRPTQPERQQKRQSKRLRQRRGRGCNFLCPASLRTSWTGMQCIGEALCQRRPSRR